MGTAIPRRKPSRKRGSARSDFDRVLDLLASDEEFEQRVLADPAGALAAFKLDEDELAVLQQYRRWRVFK
jgi:hypothetical protein